MASKLELYNGALTHLGLRPLSALTESSESRRALDSIYDRARLYALEQGFWKFAMRTSKIDYSASVTPAFGYSYAFQKPTDLLRLHKIAHDEMLDIPLNAYLEEQDYYFADPDEIYIRYVSSDASYGLDLTKYTPAFQFYLELFLAFRVMNRLTPSVDVGKQGNNNLERQMKTALADAIAKDALQGPAEFPPESGWTRARRGGNYRDDRGKRGQLIG